MIFMKSLTNLIVAGLAVAGASVVGYRAYEIKKLRNAAKEENAAESEVEKGTDDSRK